MPIKHKQVLNKEGNHTCTCKQTVHMPTPKRGDEVWVNFFTPESRRDAEKGTARASVQMRLFDHALPEYLGKPRNLRWVLVQPGRPFNQGYGMAWKPEHVFDCQLAAEKNLQNRMLDKIVEIEDVMKQLNIWTGGDV